MHDDVVRSLFQQAAEDRVMQAAMQMMEEGIIVCMRHEGRSLEGAIASNDALLAIEMEHNPDHDNQSRVISQQAWDAVKAKARSHFAMMRELVKLDADGTDEPVPVTYDEWKTESDKIREQYGV